MATAVIAAEGLGKRYQRGAVESRGMLRDSIMKFARNPLAALRRSKQETFWALKELFHDVKYAYAITAHRAQGSTYENVYVDYQDILMNRERREAFQCLYVACSRPTTKLILA